MARKRGVPGLSFSLARAFGVTAVKQNVGRSTGIPVNRTARQRRAGAAMGCCVILCLPVLGLILAGLRIVAVIA